MSDAPKRAFPRPDYASIGLYSPDRRPVEIDLCDNTNRWGVHPDALAAVRNADVERLTRYPILYSDELRAACAERFGIEPDQVTTGAGSDDVLDSLWRSIAEYGGLVRWPAPTFSMIEPFCRMNGRTAGPVAWADAVADPMILLEPDPVEGDPVLVYVCRPNNPTGHSVDRGWIDELVAAADERPNGGPVLVFDEAYAEYAKETLIPLAVERPRTLVTRTLSKAYGLAGLRVGVGIGTRETVLEIEKSRGPYKVSQLAEIAAVAALRDAGDWVAGTVEQAIQNRERFIEEVRSRGFDTLPSSGNFVFLMVADGTSTELSNALREHGVAVRPFATEAGFPEGLRVSIGRWEELERVLEAIDAIGDAMGPTERPIPELVRASAPARPAEATS